MEKSRNFGENNRFTFIKQVQNRSKHLALEVIRICDDLPSKRSSSVILYQIIKSATSEELLSIFSTARKNTKLNKGSNA